MADIIFPGEIPAANLGSTRLPENLDLTIWQGDAQEYFILLTADDVPKTPIDLTGCTAQAVIRETFNAPVAHAFVCTIEDDPVIEGKKTNKVRLYMSSPDSKNIPGGDYVWNFQITAPNGDVRTYLAGDVTVHAEVD